ncbi:hypothetical protein B0H12DRAFT_1305449 [Mycena haematopus]|nr:hypothetical protein B0H12DRAFT_1305449 [Mycena haematopus]
MSLLHIPPEVRGIILNFCFPPTQTYVQIIPYRTSLPACRLNLPLALYRVCKLITSELEPLPAKLRRLDFTYIIRGPSLHNGWRHEYGDKHDDDYDHFPFIMRFAERVRLVGAGPICSRGRSLGSAVRFLRPGPECALKVLEVQPCAWSKDFLVLVMLKNLGPLTTHPDVATRLEVRLVRDAADPLVDDEEVKAVLRRYQAQREGGEREGPIWVNLAELEMSHEGTTTDFGQIEAWLKKFQDVKIMKHRSEWRGPLNGANG